MTRNLKLTIIVWTIIFLPFTNVTSLVLTTFSRRPVVNLNEKIKPIVDTYRDKHYEEVSDHVNDPQILIERYRTRSVLLQHTLRTLRTRLVLLQDTIRRLVRERKKTKLQHQLYEETVVRSSKQMEMELRKLEEINQQLQEKYDSLSLEQINSKGKSKLFLQTLQTVVNELQDELTKVTRDTSTRDEIVPSDPNGNKDKENESDDTEEWEKTIHDLRRLNERVFLSWDRERKQMETDLLRIKMKNNTQTLQLERSEVVTSTNASDEKIKTTTSEMFEMDTSTRQDHNLKYRINMQGLWRNIQSSVRGIFQMFEG